MSAAQLPADDAAEGQHLDVHTFRMSCRKPRMLEALMKPTNKSVRYCTTDDIRRVRLSRDFHGARELCH